MKKKKIVSLLLSAVMVISLLGFGAVTAMADDTYNVSIQFTFPEESAAGALEVLAQIEEASGGRIHFDPYYSYSFVEQGDIIDALETNQLNIAGFMPTEFSILALNGRVPALPLLNYPNWEAACKIYLKLLYSNEEMLKEFTDNGMVFWAGYMVPGYQFYSAREITDYTPKAFSGLTVMCDNAEMQQLINTNGGGAITAFPPDYLSNLQNGVAEAVVQHLNAVFVFGCLEYIKTAIFFGEGGFYNLPCVYCFSDTFWNSLPEDLQAIFGEYADDLCKASYESDLGLYANAAYPTLEEKCNIVVLDDAQIAEWQDACKDIVTGAMDSITMDSAAAPEIYEQLKDLIANYDEETFEIGTNNFGYETAW